MKLTTVVLVLGAMVLLGVQAVSAGGAIDPADLSLIKSDNPDPVGEDAVLTYTIEVQNGGPDAATNVVVTDNLPSQVDPGSATPSAGNCEVRGKRVTCELGTIATGGSATVTIEVTTKKAGEITNTAEVASDVEDPQTANNEDSETTTVTTAPPTATCRKKAATITGTDAGETLNGTDKKDVIVAGGGDDLINGGAANDLICAGGGNDRVLAGSGNDFVKGQRGRDKIKGQSGGDTLRGNRGRDKLRGGSGNDLLAGGKGRDSCRGGRGRDTLRSC
jgi:uncharacterized repeat protein (TIGR01451 family)